jgi:hypothetical protein
LTQNLGMLGQQAFLLHLNHIALLLFLLFLGGTLD